MVGPLESTRAIVFDLDGTLVDSLDDIAWHLNAALVDVQLPTHSREEIRGWVGTGAMQLVAKAVPNPDFVTDVFARFQAHYKAAPYARTHVFEGLAAALDELVRGRTLAILSNKPHHLVVRIAEHLLGRWPFAAIVGEQPGRPRKPDPGSVLSIIDELGVPRERCVYVGDSEIDIATARAAGIASVAVAWGLRDPGALAAANPDYLVATPAELAGLFA